MTDTEAAERAAWQELASACIEGDVIREAHALADLRRLLPEQRTP
jgi:hypothetical protein